MKSEVADIARINHILVAIELIENFVKDINTENFKTNKLVASACLYQLLIIGEACKHISDETKSKNSEVKWRQAYSLRNKLAHEYDEIVLATIHKTIRIDFPVFKTHIKNILSEILKKDN